MKTALLVLALIFGGISAQAQSGAPYSVFTPLVSTVPIVSISGNGTTAVATCATNCAMPTGTLFVITNTSQTACNGTGPQPVLSTTGTTVTFASTACTLSTGGDFAINSAGLFLGNAGAATNTGIYFLIDYDGHLTEQLELNGATKSYLDLDTNGTAGLWNFVAGYGMYVDSQGSACFGDSVIAVQCATTAFGNGGVRGALTKYQGLSAASGNGVPFIVYVAKNVPLSGDSQGPFTLWTTPAAPNPASPPYGAEELYRVTVVCEGTATAPSATLAIGVKYTTAVESHTETSTAFPMAAVGNIARYEVTFMSAPDTPIAVTMTGTNSPSYIVSAEVAIN